MIVARGAFAGHYGLIVRVRDAPDDQRALAEEQRAIAVLRRKEAEEQTETAQQVSQFLSGLFEDARA